MRDFHMTETAALNYPLARAFALANFAIEANPWSAPVRESSGYIAQEIEQLQSPSSHYGKRS